MRIEQRERRALFGRIGDAERQGCGAAWRDQQRAAARSQASGHAAIVAYCWRADLIDDSPHARLMTQNPRQRRRELVVRALNDAISRLDAAGSNEAQAFAATSEALFWVVAADEDLRSDPAEAKWRQVPVRYDSLRAMRFPRNAAAHDATVWANDPKDVYTKRYWSHYGAWIWKKVPAPSVSSPPTQRDKTALGQHAAYQFRLEGHPVLDTLANICDDLAQHFGVQL